jgi:hypothetical protein
MYTVRQIQKQVTRPTSVTVMLILFRLFIVAFPSLLDDQSQQLIYDIIGVIGALGLTDMIISNWKRFKIWMKEKLLTKKLTKNRFRMDKRKIIN